MDVQLLFQMERRKSEGKTERAGGRQGTKREKNPGSEKIGQRVWQHSFHMTLIWGKIRLTLSFHEVPRLRVWSGGSNLQWNSLWIFFLKHTKNTFPKTNNSSAYDFLLKSSLPALACYASTKKDKRSDYSTPVVFLKSSRLTKSFVLWLLWKKNA